MVGRIGAAAASIALLMTALACTQAPQESGAPPAQEAAASSTPMAANAVANLKPTQGNTVTGTINLAPMGDGVHLSGTLTAVPAGTHGFHIHENGDCSAPDASSAGGHFNPGGKPHGAPDSPDRHAGDPGNIQADASGQARVDIHATGITLSPGPTSIMGKAIIVHANPDDFSQPTGNAGARLACGVIEPASM